MAFERGWIEHGRVGDHSHLSPVPVVGRPSATPCPLCAGPMLEVTVTRAPHMGRVAIYNERTGQSWVSTFPVGSTALRCPDCDVNFISHDEAGPC
jgi:hypothetical protein